MNDYLKWGVIKSTATNCVDNKLIMICLKFELILSTVRQINMVFELILKQVTAEQKVWVVNTSLCFDRLQT